MRLLFFALALAVLSANAEAQTRLKIAWPTPNKAYFEGKPIEDYIQPTASGEPRSGTFGCVRSGGFQFHEGLDLKPISRDRQGEATDPIFAVMDGVVRHINNRAGDSSYGRYIVIEHPGATPAIITLYAHLAKIEPGIRIGSTVERGQVIATMGRSAGGYGIPKERAHLHFEMGVITTDNFERWYAARKFGSPNRHGDFNGMNILGFDPKAFFDDFRAKRANDVIDFLRAQPIAVKLHVGSRHIPDYVRRYPSLLKGSIPLAGPAGWEVECLWSGFPVSLRALDATEAAGLSRSEIRFVEINRSLLVQNRGVSLVRTRGSRQIPGSDLSDILEKLFNLR